MARRLLVLFASLTIVAALAPQVSASDSAIVDAIAFRQKFGLNTDPSYVSGVFVSDEADMSYGVPLTHAERADLDDRQRRQRELGPLTSWAEALPGFAGLWIDQRRGGLVHIALTTSQDILGTAQKLAPSGQEVEAARASYSLDQLNAISDAIFADIGELAASAIAVRHLYVDVPNNGVMVGVKDPSTATVELQRRYGPMIEIEQSSPVTTDCTDKEHCYGPPLRAGISGAPAGTRLADRCSVAFLVHAGSAVQWLTAGHCATTTGVAWYHAGDRSWPMGTIKATCWPQCTYSDAARGGNINFTYSSQHVFAVTGDSNAWPIFAREASGGDVIGQVVCLNARKDVLNLRCGHLLSKGTMSYNNGTVWFSDMRFADYPGKYGDSGGAVQSAYLSGGSVAMGIQSGCTGFASDRITCDVTHGKKNVYSHISHVVAELGVSVCTLYDPCQ